MSMIMTPAEPLTADERAAFMAELVRLGPSVVGSMLEVRRVKRFSHLRKVDRILFLAALRKVRK